MRGNREVPVGYAVIPAKMAEDFKKATPEQRKEMIKQDMLENIKEIEGKNNG
jgi:hypothetical protein